MEHVRYRRRLPQLPVSVDRNRLSGLSTVVAALGLVRFVNRWLGGSSVSRQDVDAMPSIEAAEHRRFVFRNHAPSERSRRDLQPADFSGERGRNRTFNLLIKSQLLCQLSYAPGNRQV